MGDEWVYDAEKHAKNQERIFEAIHDIHLIVARNESKVLEVKEAVDDMKKSLHGTDGNQGVVGSVGTFRNQMTLQWVLIFGAYVFTSAVGVYLIGHLTTK